jgi:uncharacterized protein
MNIINDKEQSSVSLSDVETRPLPNFHTCRLRVPGDFDPDSFKTMARYHHGKKYEIIIGKLKGDDATTEQSYRYPKGVWSAKLAKGHCMSHKGIEFTPASEAKTEELVAEDRAVWTAKYINDLPDSAFLYIESGGSKDDQDKTTPRSLRHFPYKDKNGKVDQAHLKNALGRIPQSSLPADVKKTVAAKAKKLYDDLFGKKSLPSDGREIRISAPADVELRVEDSASGPKLVGYAAKYEKWSEDLGVWTGSFKEKIRSGAFDAVIKTDDVRCLKNHDPNLLLGRTSSGTMRLSSDKVGLRFEVDLPDTNTGNDTAEEVRRGDLSGCSFAFRVETDEWKHLPDGTSERTLIKISRLFDVGPVTYPAYPDTDVAVRALEEHLATVEAAKPEPQPAEQPKVATAPVTPSREIQYGYEQAERIIARNEPSKD